MGLNGIDWLNGTQYINTDRHMRGRRSIDGWMVEVVMGGARVL